MQYPIRTYLRAIYDYLRYGWRGRWQNLLDYLKEQPRWKLALIFVGGPFAALSLFVLIMFAGLHLGWYGPLPSKAALADIHNDQASSVYSEDGVLLGKYYIENRIDVPLTDISPFVTQALIATEDARFFRHGGVDFRALLRVAWKSILWRNESSGGGSTISQQLAKNLYPRKRYRWFGMLKNKLREMATASRLEKVYTKEQLLELYLNTVPFGEGAFGIQVAARRFFNQHPSALKVEEAATLIGLLKANTVYNPRRHPEAARNRRNVVLQQMNKAANLNAPELDSLQQLPLTLDFQPEGNNQGPATYFREHLRRELKTILADHPREDGTTYDLYRDGLRIYTSIDARIQQHAEAAVTEQMPLPFRGFQVIIGHLLLFGGTVRSIDQPCLAVATDVLHLDILFVQGDFLP
ncbi:MAG: transglycosylase domain-containing protein, partial [Bacteroidota bacterium]